MMPCAECRDLLNAFVDNELMVDEAEEARTHLAACPDCAREAKEIAETSRLLRDGLDGHRAPALLKARIRSAIVAADATPDTGAAPAAPTLPDPPRRAGGPRRWMRLAAAGLVIAAVSSLATDGVVRDRGSAVTMQDEVLASHLRSLMPGHLTDVASTDQHNVKPWFNGRLDLSPPVPGLDSSGFVLDGGRLDYIGGRTVAAVVYLRRQHVINVFSWPDAGDDRRLSVATSRGYHLVSWRSNGVALWVVSDLNTAELSEFVALFQRGGADVQR